LPNASANANASANYRGANFSADQLCLPVHGHAIQPATATGNG